MKIILCFLLMMLSVICFGECERAYTTKIAGSNISKFNIQLTEELKVNNIVYKYEKLTDSWRLLYRDANSLTVLRKDKIIYPCDGISSDMLEILIDKSIEKLISDKNFVKLDQIQIELKLVSDIWRDVVENIKNAAKSQTGVVHHNNEQLFFIALRTLDSSMLVNRVCNKLEQQSLVCATPRVGFNPIAFNESVLGKEWQSLMPLKDAGLADGTWFSIRFTKKTFDQAHQ